ncbi:hypothetical protein XA3_02960 [Xylocopilactobacillus apicola]|uniref:RamC N-terminal domain-containing protein n=1 Tax=Xylocopilactobacillus apicola TaxID=2932184 RepID=A0AAU9DDG4_9LACO|nr:hypothetical protein XA3_02960 [Xylocopilactobacillus apicola]
MKCINVFDGSYDIKVKGEFSVIDDRSFNDVLFHNRICLKDFWKIHVSPKIEDYVEVLDITSELLISENINFKFVKNRKLALSFVSSDCSMGSSGKLITIYPNSIS